MKLRFIAMLISIALLFSFLIIFSCEGGKDGADGEDGADGQNVSADDDDDSADDDDDDDDDDNDDDEDWGPEDLFYYDDCPELAGCVFDNCGHIEGVDSFELLQCSLVSCETEYDTCFGPYGDGECVNVLKCLQQCLPADCQQECMAPASYESLLEFADLGICVEDNCPSALENPLGNIGCFTGVCLDPVEVCCGGSLLGCM